MDSQSENFYVYKGITNDLTSYIKESQDSPRFQTAYASFDNYWIRYDWKDVVGGSTNYEIDYPDPPSDSIKPQWLYDHGITLSIKILGGSYNPFNIYYNSTYRNEIINLGIQNIQDLSWSNLVSDGGNW